MYHHQQLLKLLILVIICLGQCGGVCAYVHICVHNSSLKSHGANSLETLFFYSIIN